MIAKIIDKMDKDFIAFNLDSFTILSLNLANLNIFNLLGLSINKK